jgi:hypothetical protein
VVILRSHYSVAKVIRRPTKRRTVGLLAAAPTGAPIQARSGWISGTARQLDEPAGVPWGVSARADPPAAEEGPSGVVVLMEREPTRLLGI